jgi:PKD repeat protein
MDLAYKHTGNQLYLDTAGRLFRSIMAAPFSGPGWQFGTYATINEAGKYAEFGGTYITVAHSETLPENTPPVAEFSLSPTGGTAPPTVATDASAAFDPDGEIVVYAWNWGDASPTESGSSPFASHIYQEGPASRTISLTVTDNQGVTAQTSAQVKVEAPKVAQSVLGTVRIRSIKGRGPATVQFNITRSKNKQGYQGFVSFRDDGAGIYGQATLKPSDAVSPLAPNGAAGLASGTARSGNRSGKVNLK